MNVTAIHAYDRNITNPFGLLGADENALSFALGYTFQQCPQLLQWFLRSIGVSGVRLSALHKARIDLQRRRDEESAQGITDIEIHLPGCFHVIVEAKIGLAVPTIRQCKTYLARFHDEPRQKLVTLIQSPDKTLLQHRARQDRDLSKRLVGFNWASFFPECVRLIQGKRISTQSKEWLRAFYTFLDQDFPMKAFSTEVWILAISTKPLWANGLSHWDIHQKYRLWWDYKDHMVRPLYLAFRVEGKLDSICRVNRIEHDVRMIDVVSDLHNVKKSWPKKPATIWYFDPPVKLGTQVRTGGGMYARRVRCDLDLLLSCNSVQQIEAAMSNGKR
jgi:hypothetical protein